MILGRVIEKSGEITKSGGGSKRSVGKHRPENSVLKASEGYFKNGILDVKHLLRSTPSKENDAGAPVINKWKKGSGKKKGKKGGGRKGGGKKHH